MKSLKTTVLKRLLSQGVMLTALFAGVLGAGLACGSSGSDAGQEDTGSGGVLQDRVITKQTSIYTMDDLVAQGYKKSREFATETLGGASEAWYGFFNQRDIEVWVYASHDDAMNAGVPVAETVISREAGQTDFLIPVVNRYPAFAVAGNLVMLCEREVATCEGLIEKLP